MLAARLPSGRAILAKFPANSLLAGNFCHADQLANCVHQRTEKHAHRLAEGEPTRRICHRKESGYAFAAFSSRPFRSPR